MKSFCFTVDDNIRFFKDLTENNYSSIFENPYLAMYKRLHGKFGLKVQLNLFYQMEGFDLSKMTDRYIEEWKANSDWLKLSFHSRLENERPYELSPYDEVYRDCSAVHEHICRFASKAALAKTTTVHYCLATKDGLSALSQIGVRGLLGLFGTDEEPMISYGLSATDAKFIRSGGITERDGMYFACIDIVLNLYDTERILDMLKALRLKEHINVMIHEQYFYKDYPAYQPNFEEKLTKTFEFFEENGYQSCFFENLLPKANQNKIAERCSGDKPAIF